MKMRSVSVAVLSAVLLGAAPPCATAQSLSEIFKRVDPAVVVIHTKEKEIPTIPDTQPVSVAGLGSGVLVSSDGQVLTAAHVVQTADRSEEHTSELQSLAYLVCRLLLEKKKIRPRVVRRPLSS